MASIIKARTISSIVDNRVRLTNSNCARLWSSDVGTAWTKIRVGCRMSIENTGASITSTPRFAFGICSGTSNIFMDPTTTHWAGFLTNATTMPFYSNGNYTTSGECVVAKRISSTLTIGSIIASNFSTQDCTTAARSMLCLDITKGSPNFTFQAFYNQTLPTADVPLATYISQLTLTTPAFSNHGFGTAQTLAIDETTNGFFNAVNVAWDRSSPAIELSDIAVVKLA